jgi:diphosphomevalonate decarboxylase
MMTSSPPLLYWLPATLEILHAIRRWRAEGLPVCYTIDAGLNVHAICTAQDAGQVEAGLRGLPGVEEVIASRPGGPARLISTE